MLGLRLFTFFFIFFCSLVVSANECAHIIQSLDQVKKVRFDSSVELELPMGHNLMGILTTTDGTTGALLEANNKSVPKWFKEYFNENLWWTHYNTRNLPWEMLNFESKLKLLQYVSKNRQIPFFENREVLGMKVKDELSFRFTKPTVFMGKEYSKGTHKIDVSTRLGKVEYRSPDDMKLDIGIELHFREGLNAAAVSHDARTFLEGLRIKPTHQHIHITSRLPIKKLQELPHIQSLVLTDFYARVNMVAEMFDIIYNQRAITTRYNSKDKSIILFDHLKNDDLGEIQYYFELIARGKKPKVGSEFKMGWVGLRGFDTYDGNDELWGLEFRANLIDEPHHKKALILDGVQEAMHHQRFGLSKSAVEEWTSSMQSTRGSFNIAESYYHRAYLDSIPKKLADLLTDQEKRKIDALIDRWGNKHGELYMLVHDWSTSSILYKKAVAQKKIVESQHHYLLELIDKKNIDSKKISILLGQFLKDSGLFSYHLDSLGIKNFPVN